MIDTENDLLQLTETAIRSLVSLDVADQSDIVIKQCRSIAETIGTMLAPQLYGARIHGVGNAVSIVIRSCSEALFWLNFSAKKPEAAIAAVSKLRDVLMSPGI